MIGILGGTFDPVHPGHIYIASELARKFHFSELRLIPCYLPAHRQAPSASALDRLNMLELAIKDHPELSIDKREFERQGISYAIDTLKSIRSEIAKDESLVLILGMDAFNSLHEWKEWQDLLKYCHLLVINRAGVSPTFGAELTALLEAHQIQDPVSLKTKAAGSIYFQNLNPMDISATELRNQYQELKKQPAIFQIAAVAHYINQHKLYRNTMTLDQLSQLVNHTLEEAKALDITQIDVTQMTDVCDTIFICTSTSNRHGKSIENKLIEAAKEQSIRPLGIEEDLENSWILVDLSRVVIHIMTAETRAFYNLEQLWDLTLNSRENHAD